MSNQKVLLAILAHPDDESFGEGGTYAKYAREGVDVHICIATDGASGSVADPERRRNIVAVRAAELEKSIEILGATLHTLNYRDSGYLNDPENNNNPAAFIQADMDEVIGRIVHLIRQIKPDVVITHDETGGYYHPDHIRCWDAATQAFAAASKPDAYAELGLPPHQPARLYYNAFPKSRLWLIVFMMRLKRQDPSKAGQNEDIDLTGLGIESKKLHAKIDYRRYWDIAKAAAAAHVSQGSDEDGVERFIPLAFRKRFMAKDTFIRAYPPVADGFKETDLFP